MSSFLDEQVAMERRAIRLIRRADVQAALEGQAARWRDGTAGFLPETYAQLRASIEEVVLLVALQVVNGDAARPRVVEISAGPHRWGGLDVPGGRWGINNPDTLYFAVPIARGARYRVDGLRHADGPVDLNVSVQVPDVWSTLDNLGLRDLAVDPDGRYRITLDDAPAGGRRNHLQIREGGGVLLIRQTLADWATARPDALAITRTEGPPPGPEPTDDDLARRIVARMEVVIGHSLDTLQPPIFRHPVNTIPQPGAAADKPGYLVTQRNALGHFRLDDDEALVAVLTPGGAGYAALTATNVWGVTPDATRHQNSLNNHQAIPNPDGTITLVVANRDPGFVNWIDPGGSREGILMVRWQLLNDGGATGEPAIAVRRVSRDALPSALPKDAARLDPAQRRRQLEARARAYARRFADR
ncbi:hypothetical protein [Methylobacterium sp. JK268]